MSELKLKIEYMSVSELIPYARNPRKNDHAIERGASFIREFGFLVPVLIKRDLTIIDGHLRLKCAKKLKMDEVPTITIDHLNDIQIKALRLSINKFSELADWDEDLLKDELMELDNLQYDVDLLGFDVKLDGENGGTEGLTDPDEVPEVPQNVFGVKRGDIWLLGNHRLMCGDSTSEDDVNKLMDGHKADMVFTDPPYNIASDSKNFAANVSTSMNELSNADWDKNFKIEPAIDRLIDSISENATMYIWTSHFLINDIWKHLKDFGYINYLVWSKPNPMPSLSKRHPAWNTELCVYTSRGSKRVVNYPSQGHFLSCREVIKKSDGTHPTQKPLELITPIVEFSSNQGQMILDLFLGSGSTLIACEKTGRTCYGMELDEHYCSVIIKRWQDFTGKTAIKEETHG